MLKKILTVIFPLFILISCGGERGTLVFKANGEDFVTNGFVSKDRWYISFDRVLVNIDGIEAYNVDDESLSVCPEGPFLVDLKASEGKGNDVTVVETANVPAGNYQSLRFSLRQIKAGEFQGYSIIMVGRAKKGGQTIPYIIKLDDELTFDGREGYVGDSIKGILKNGDQADVEMTFHFDHLFGDIEAGAHEHVNSRSPGFALFYDFEKKGRIDISGKEMTIHSLYPLLIEGIDSLGHLGEGHCEVIR